MGKSLAIVAIQDDRMRQIIEAWDGLSEGQKAAVIEIVADYKKAGSQLAGLAKPK